MEINTNEIGDGKTPNKYWVSVSNDYYYFNHETGGLDWVSEHNLFPVKSFTVKVFETYGEALNYCNEDLYLGMDYFDITVNSMTIEDRISGEIFFRTREFYPESATIEDSTRQDTDFTEKKLRELNIKFI